MRERSRRASPQPEYSWLSVDAGSDLDANKSSAPTARVFRSYVSYESTHSSISRSSCWARMVEKNTTRSASARLFVARLVIQRRRGCLSPGPSEVHSARCPDIAVVHVGLKFVSPKT